LLKNKKSPNPSPSPQGKGAKVPLWGIEGAEHKKIKS